MHPRLEQIDVRRRVQWTFALSPYWCHVQIYSRDLWQSGLHVDKIMYACVAAFLFLRAMLCQMKIEVLYKRAWPGYYSKQMSHITAVWSRYILDLKHFKMCVHIASVPCLRCFLNQITQYILDIFQYNLNRVE